MLFASYSCAGRIWILGTLLSVGLFLVPASGCKKGDGENQGGKTPALKPEFTLSIDEFTTEYIKDEKGAGKKFNGKVVALTGPISTISPQQGGKFIVVQLEGAKKDPKDIIGTFVQGLLDPSHNEVAVGLGRGQKVELVGPVEGNFGATIINLGKGSTVKELEKSPLIRVTSEELAKEFANDAKAAGEKYKAKEVLLSGLIVETFKKNDFNYARLQGDGKFKVRITLGADEAKNIKKGQTVRIRAADAEAEDGEIALQMGSVVEVK